MNILYLNSSPFDSEMANLIQVKAMCKAMASLGLQVTLSVPGNKPASLKYEGYSLHFRKKIVKSKFDKYVNIFSLIHATKKTNPDIIYVRDPLILLYVFLFTKNKMIFESHNYCLHEGISFLNRLYRWVLKKTISKGSVIKMVCISHALSNYWVTQGIPENKLIAAHDGIDLDMFSGKISKEQARKNLSLLPNKTIVTYSGRLYANRKIDNILTLAASFPQIDFLVVGGPNYNALEFKKEADNLKITNIQFAGQVKHEMVPEYLAASDILLALWSSDVPTINYCSPLKIFEYMAAQKVILAHGFPTIKEVLTDKTDALLIEPDSTEDLIKKLNDALQHTNQAQLAHNAYEKVKNEYTWQKRVQLIFGAL